MWRSLSESKAVSRVSGHGDRAPETVLLFFVISGSDLSVHVYYGVKPGTE